MENRIHNIEGGDHIQMTDVDNTKLDMSKNDQTPKDYSKDDTMAMKRATTIKMSDNEEVRKELIIQSTPNALTSFFYQRPCISIWTPYILLFIFTAIISQSGYFDIAMMDDAWLINDDVKVINKDMVTLAKWELNRRKAGIDDKKESLEANQVRFETTDLSRVLIIYENKGSHPGGLMNKESIKKIMELEHQMTMWNS